MLSQNLDNLSPIKGKPMAVLEGSQLTTNHPFVYNAISNHLNEVYPHLPCEYVYNVDNDQWDGRDSEIMAPMPEIDDFMIKKSKLAAPTDIAPEVAAAYTHPLLTREQELHIARRMNYCKFKACRIFNDARSSGRLMRRDAINLSTYHDLAISDRDLLVNCNLRLVINLTRKRIRSPQQFQELLSDGNLSLLKAIENFDYSRNFRFATYASWAIIKNHNRSIKLLVEYERRNATNFDDDTIVSIIDVNHDRRIDEHNAEINEWESKFRDLLKRLDEREQLIISLRHGRGMRSPSGRLNWTLQEIGDHIGITKERVRQVHDKALIKIKDGVSTNS